MSEWLLFQQRDGNVIRDRDVFGWASVAAQRLVVAQAAGPTL